MSNDTAKDLLVRLAQEEGRLTFGEALKITRASDDLSNALHALVALTSGGFVSYDIEITLRLTPFGWELAKSLDHDA